MAHFTDRRSLLVFMHTQGLNNQHIEFCTLSCKSVSLAVLHLHESRISQFKLMCHPGAPHHRMQELDEADDLELVEYLSSAPMGLDQHVGKMALRAKLRQQPEERFSPTKDL